MYTLNNGVKIPEIAFGTWKITDEKTCVDSVVFALKTGYRHIDTAAIYGNEKSVGEGIKKFLAENKDVKREDIFVTTKLWNDRQGYEETFKAFEESLTRLGLDYVDLYLIHWPNTKNMEKTIASWKAFEELYKAGKIKSIGVCNFKKHHFEELLSHAEIVPAINQIELHPLSQKEDMRKYCKEKGIVVEAWSPLMQGNLSNDVIAEIAEKYNKSSAQIILKWHLQNGVLPLPKSVTPSRIIENFSLDFTLEDSDMEKIKTLNEDKIFGSDPDNMTRGFED